MKALKKIGKIMAVLFLVLLLGLGEASHGNAEFQELKLEVLKVLVDKYNVDCFAMEMDYGEGVIINDYINGHSEMSIDEVMSRINFTIYKTEDIRDLIAGSLGESYSILNTILQDTVRIYCEPKYLYDAMILIYECTPLNLLIVSD